MVFPTQFQASPSGVGRTKTTKDRQNRAKKNTTGVGSAMGLVHFAPPPVFSGSTHPSNISLHELDGSRNTIRFLDDPVDDIFDILCQRVTAAPETDLDPLSTRTVSIAGGVVPSSVLDDHCNNRWWQTLDPAISHPFSNQLALYEPMELEQITSSEIKAEDSSEEESEGVGGFVSPESSLQSETSSDGEVSEDCAPPPVPPSNPHPDLPPLRALSAYNFFFRDERERLLYGGDLCLSSSKCNMLLTQHWTRDRTQKRRHRKTHGKIPFTELSKIVSRKWKELDDSQKDFYRRVSSLDWERYQKELEDYKARQKKKEAEEAEEEEEEESSDASVQEDAAVEGHYTYLGKGATATSAMISNSPLICQSFYSYTATNETEI